MQQLENKIMKRKAAGSYRQLSHPSNLIDFASNDYLGLASSIDLRQRFLLEYEKMSQGLGSTGARLLSGNSIYAEEIEKFLAKFHGYEAALLFNCGYMANIGLISTITLSTDVIFYDAEIHASTREGIRLCKGLSFAFRHNDLDHLEKKLKNSSKHGQRYICIESIYSTDGTLAPLQAICDLAKTYEAKVIVDEAHALGVVGPNGRGFVSQCGLEEKVFAQIVTFGKAAGVQGAMILGSSFLKEFLINYCPSFIYTTALPYFSLAAIIASYQLFSTMDKERSTIETLIKISQQQLDQASASHIQIIKMDGNPTILNMAKKLGDLGFAVSALRSPTVKKGEEVLRISLHSHNSVDQLKALLQEIKNG